MFVSLNTFPSLTLCSILLRASLYFPRWIMLPSGFPDALVDILINEDIRPQPNAWIEYRI
jgi:hypothetical protein